MKTATARRHLRLATTEQRFSFQKKLDEFGLDLSPQTLDTLQVNITKLCNQACHHCHVDASPKRTEQMSLETIEQILVLLASHAEIRAIDITGGAPELNPHFEHLVRRAIVLGKHVIVRHNLTVTFDGCPVTGRNMEHLPRFFADNGVELISSLPYYQAFFTDRQRGRGVFEKSIASLRRLNEVGYAAPTSDLVLNLIYNPVGAFLPAPQKSLEADYKRELDAKFAIRFNKLYTITNMPIHRFAEQLKRNDTYDEYMDKLIGAFNPIAAMGVMCRNLLSVSWDGRLFDCDFNQMLEMELNDGEPLTVFNFDLERLKARQILFADHCYGCTAGAGSSCGGA
ncbi:MAG: arsenosugar biosynthesis radical SAM protein ArsS, partial [Myxococcales bacterium]|nr:arsenosugar biosynthesis radical SAM protein ArsS [Myxococcales bacterium]